MKNLSRLVIVAAFASIAMSPLAARAQYAGPNGARAMTVKELLADGRDNQHVALQGRIVKHLGGDDYEFADATGTVRVEIDAHLWAGHPVIDDKDQVKLTGEFERHLLGRESVEVETVEILK